MEQGPVLVINFNAQQIMVVRDAKGKVVEGDPVSSHISHFFLSLHYLSSWQQSTFYLFFFSINNLIFDVKWLHQ